MIRTPNATRFNTQRSTSMKHANSTPTAPVRATVSAFTILIERSLQMLTQTLMPRLATLQPVPLRRARMHRGR